MKGSITFLAAAGLMALAACGSKDKPAEDGKPQSEEQVKQEAAKLETPVAGEYRQKVEITRFEVPGLPKEAAEQMKAAMKATQENTICLSQADAEKGYRDMFKNVGQGNDCAYSKFDVDGGKLDAQMDCKSPQGNSKMTLKGMVRSDGSDVTVDVETSGGPAPVNSTKMTMQVTSTRLGDCKAT